jgi:16S rRNA U1498 N3-methylase RsmE
MVEKLSELGVAEVRFLDTVHGTGRPPKPDRARAWSVSGLEQSRGAWLMRIEDRMITWSDLGDDALVCDVGAPTEAGHARTVVIGPEGGWAPGEVPATATRWGLGSTVLRVETAAIVAASRLL